MASCLGNCIRQPNIKALNIQGALRWREMYKWIIPPRVNTHRIWANGEVREKGVCKGIFDKLQWFKMMENGNENKSKKANVFPRQEVVLSQIKQNLKPFSPAHTTKTNSASHNIRLSPLTVLILWRFCCDLLLHQVASLRKLCSTRRVRLWWSINPQPAGTSRHIRDEWKNESVEVLWSSRCMG